MFGSESGDLGGRAMSSSYDLGIVAPGGIITSNGSRQSGLVKIPAATNRSITVCVCRGVMSWSRANCRVVGVISTPLPDSGVICLK